MVYGSDWPVRARLCRALRGNVCLRCSYIPPKSRALPVHHLMPFAVVAKWAACLQSPHDQENLIPLCVPCHGLARRADDRAKRADFVGWARELRIFCGANERMIEACARAAKHYGAPIYWLE